MDWKTVESSRDYLPAGLAQFPENRVHDFLAYSCVLCALKKVSWRDGVDAVMAVVANRHSKAEAVVADLTCVNAWLGLANTRDKNFGLAISKAEHLNT